MFIKICFRAQIFFAFSIFVFLTSINNVNALTSNEKGQIVKTLNERYSHIVDKIDDQGWWLKDKSQILSSLSLVHEAIKSNIRNEDFVALEANLSIVFRLSIALTNANFEALAGPMRTAQCSMAEISPVCESAAKLVENALSGNVDAKFVNGYIVCMYARGIELSRKHGLLGLGLTGFWKKNTQCTEGDVRVFESNTGETIIDEESVWKILNL